MLTLVLNLEFYHVKLSFHEFYSNEYKDLVKTRIEPTVNQEISIL